MVTGIFSRSTWKRYLSPSPAVTASLRVCQPDRSVSHVAGVEDSLGDHVVLGAVVLVIKVDHLADTSLHQHLRALVTREERDVDGSGGHVLERSAIIEDRIGLGVHDVVVLVKERVLVGPPGKLVIIDPGGRTVVAHGENSVVGVCDAGSDLRIRVLAPQARRNCHAHEELVPRNDVRTLTGHGVPPLDAMRQHGYQVNILAAHRYHGLGTTKIPESPVELVSEQPSTLRGCKVLVKEPIPNKSLENLVHLSPNSEST